MNIHVQNEYLKEENRQLRAMLVARAFDTPAAWGLSRCEEKLLSSLYAAPGHMRRKEALRIASCLDPDADEKVVEVRVSMMRKKLKPYGVIIQTVWGEGYELTQDSADIIRKALA